jgi:hypothetical protein
LNFKPFSHCLTVICIQTPHTDVTLISLQLSNVLHIVLYFTFQLEMRNATQREMRNATQRGKRGTNNVSQLYVPVLCSSKFKKA